MIVYALTAVLILLFIVLILLVRDRIRSKRRLEQVRSELVRSLDTLEDEIVAELSTQTVPKRIMEHLRTGLASQSEQFAAFNDGFGYDPKDARFLGAPIDFVVFNGRSNGSVDEVVFIEVKQHERVRLTAAEQSLREAIETGKVRWERLDLSREAGVTTQHVREIGSEDLKADVSRSVRERMRGARERFVERITKDL